jgi:protein ERP2
MILLLLLCNCFLFLSLLPSARSSALTTAIAANERLCFYVDADKAGEKIGVSLTGHVCGVILK